MPNPVCLAITLQERGKLILMVNICSIWLLLWWRNDVTGNFLQGNPQHMVHISQLEKSLHTKEFLHMQTFLRLAYMCHVTRIPLKVVPSDIIV